MAFDRGILIMSLFVQSRFSNFSMIWMFHSPKQNERINCSLESILKQSAHILNATKNFTVKNSLILKIMKGVYSIFENHTFYEFRHILDQT